MKKTLLTLLLFSIYFSVIAQETPIVKDFKKDVKSIVQTLKLNDKVNIMAINTDNDNMEITAIAADMHVLWSTPLKGYGLVLANFKGKVLAVAATEYTAMKRASNTYKGFMINPANGHVDLEKIIYDGQQENFEFSYFFSAEDGSFFKLGARETNLRRGMHMLMPGLFSLLSVNKIDNDTKFTNKITVMDYDDQLNPVNKFNPIISDGVLSSMDCNYKGDLFLAWYNGAEITLMKYIQGKKDPVAKIVETVDARGGDDNNKLAFNVNIHTSNVNQNVVYCALVLKNSNKEWELSVTKFDFTNKSKKTEETVFDKEGKRNIDKSYTSPDKKINKPEFGNEMYFGVRNMTETNNRLLVSLSARFIQHAQTINAGGLVERSLLINGYDLDLNLKYQQQFPSFSMSGAYVIPINYHVNKTTMDLIGAYKTDQAIFGTLNVATGDWEKMILLPKKKIDANFPDAENAMWFPKSFTLPYADLKGITKTNRNITLQQNDL